MTYCCIIRLHVSVNLLFVCFGGCHWQFVATALPLERFEIPSTSPRIRNATVIKIEPTVLRYLCFTVAIIRLHVSVNLLFV